MNETNEKENKIDESAQQSAEAIEELINRKVEELVKAFNLTKERVLHDWKKKEASLKKYQLKDEELIERIYNTLHDEYSAMKNKYEKYSIYKTTHEYAINNYLENFEDNYLVPGLGIERGQIIEIYSTPGVGKTWLSLEMACKMAIGGWILNTPEYAVTRPLNVLYIDNENGKTLIKRLIEMELYELPLAYKNLGIIQNGGVFAEDGIKDYLPVDIDRFGKDPNDKNTETLADAINGMVMTGSIPKPDVVFFDPLADVMLGDENSTKDMKNFVYETKQFIENTGATVIINHHTRKDKKDSTEELYGSRGSTVLPGALDMAIELRVKKEGNDKKAGKNKKAGKKETDKNAEENTKQQENTESQEDTALEKIVEAKITKQNRNGTPVDPFSYGIFNTVIDELNPHWAETWTGTKFNGVVVSKIYNSAPTRARLRAEMIALMYKQSYSPEQSNLKPTAISEEEFNEKIKSIIKKYPKAYSDNDKRIDEAYKEFKELRDKYIKKW